tara:strand:- start:266 stop:439 length:174 start_codon:yes stop_codon:yes gene_type:complete
MVQTEQAQPQYSVIAVQIINIVTQLEGHDQETIRAAIHAFSQASSGFGNMSVSTRPY